MLEKPNLPDADIIAALRTGYDLAVTALEFLPIGYDSTAWLFRVQTETRVTYFLKLKKGEFYAPGVTVPHYLKANGVEPVVAPLPTITGNLYHPVNPAYSLILFPYVDAENGMEVGLTAAQWTALGTALQKLHALTPTIKALEPVRVETFTLPAQWLETIQRAQATIDQDEFAHTFEQEFAAFWQACQTEIHQIVQRAVQLGNWLQAEPPELVLCHTDIHTANVLVVGTETIHIVDWDAPLFAPRERDLMFIVEQPADHTTAFFAGYGQRSINPLALAYYRYEWIVQEFSDFANRIFFLDDVGDETRWDSAHGFRELFDPDDVVAEAYKVEADLPAAFKA